MTRYTIAITLLILTLIMSGCVEKSLEGRYENRNDLREYIVIYKDSTYRQILVDSDKYNEYLFSDNGNVKLEPNNKLVLVDHYGMSWEYTINNTGLVSKEGKFYAKNNSV